MENLLREGKGVTHKNYIDVVSIVNLPIEVNIKNFTYWYTCGVSLFVADEKQVSYSLRKRWGFWILNLRI